jgi:hypothetical protein
VGKKAVDKTCVPRGHEGVNHVKNSLEGEKNDNQGLPIWVACIFYVFQAFRNNFIIFIILKTGPVDLNRHCLKEEKNSISKQT